MPWAGTSSASSSPGPTGGAPPRTRTGGSDSIRGRISGPIPMPNPMDDDYLIREPGSGVVKPVDAPATKDPSKDPQDEPQTTDPQPRAPSTPVLRDSHTEVARDTSRATSSVAPSQSSPNTKIQSSPARTTNHSSMLRYSLISDGTVAQPEQLPRDKPQRKQSVLRSALGKLFGRKKKNRMSEMTTKSPIQAADRINSTTLNKTATLEETDRSTPIHVTDYDRDLRSQSMGPDGVMPPGSAHNSLTGDLGLAKMRSGATSTHLSGIHRINDNGPTGLSPRPASTHGRASRLTSSNDEEEEIGRAITIDFSGLKRRSRSMSGLPAIEDDQEEPRRLSAEIRYWRASYDQGTRSPPPSRPQEDNSPVQGPYELVPGPPPKTPPQPFEFGDLASMNEMAGMKITQAANMETRIGSLEARVRRLEKVVTRLCHAVPDLRLHGDSDQGPAPPAFPNSRASVPDPLSLFVFSPGAAGGSTRPSTRQSEMSLADTHTNASSILRPPPAQAFTSTRPLSTATIRGVASLPALSKDAANSLTIDHYTTLMALIETERSARQALEAEVRRLGHQVNIMGRASSYSRLTAADVSRTGLSTGETSAFDHDDDDDDEGESDDGQRVAQSGQRVSRPVRNAGVVDDDDDDDDDISGSYLTAVHSREDDEHHGEGEEDDARKKKAARTMSLSQLTFKSGPHRVANAPVSPAS